VPRVSRSTKACRIVLLAVTLAVALATSAAGATGAVHFQLESVQAFEHQLSRGEVHAATFHQRAGAGHLHLSMNDGRHFTVAYASSEEPKLAARARAGGIPVALAVATPKKATAAHHTLRYIAGGILIVVILVVAAVLLLDRRRKLGEAGGAPPTQSQPSQ
jgi:hypothetical protein